MRAQRDERIGFVDAGGSGSLLGTSLLGRTRDGIERATQGRRVTRREGGGGEACTRHGEGQGGRGEELERLIHMSVLLASAGTSNKKGDSSITCCRP